MITGTSTVRHGEGTTKAKTWEKLQRSIFTSGDLNSSIFKGCDLKSAILKSSLYNHDGLDQDDLGRGSLTKLYQCHYCTYTSPLKCNTLRHERTHTGEKPFPCPHCNFRCSQNCDLKKHIMTHTGEKPYACSQCPYRSSRKEVLKNHMRLHAAQEDI